MCGNLSWKIEKNLEKSFNFLYSAYEINGKKNSFTTLNSQKQLKVQILYQINSIRSKIIISSLCMMKTNRINDTVNENEELMSNNYFNENSALHDRELEILEKFSVFENNKNYQNSNNFYYFQELKIFQVFLTLCHAKLNFH